MVLSSTRYFLLFISILSLLLISCDNNETKEIDITVVTTKTEKHWIFGQSQWSRVAVVEYCAKNIGNTTINGWEVFFNIHLEGGTQIITHESIYCTLESEKTSKIRAVEAIIPDYYENAYKATLKHIETW